MIKEKFGLYMVTVTILVSALLVIPAASASTVNVKEYLNTNLQGSDYSTVAAPAKEDCAMACLFDTQCKAATWVHTVNQAPSCWLKNAVPPKTPYPGDMTRVMHSYIKEEITNATTPAVICLAIYPPDFTADPTEGTAPLTVHFIDYTDGISHVVWDYGDGSTGTGGLHSGQYHTYTATGKYTMRLTVYNACGQNASGTKEIFVNGPEAAGYGTLRVDTTPAGAMLYIDGYTVGTTPLQIMVNLTKGVHRIRISITGYNDYIEDITVSPGQEINLRVALTKSTPGGASPYTYQPLATTAASAHTTAGIDLKQALKDLALTQPATGDLLPGTGILIVSSNPVGANVYIDGKNEGKTPLAVPNVTAGQHNLLLTLQGYTDASRAVNVGAASENQVAVEMTAAKKTPGFAAMAGVLSIALLVLFRKRTG
jgi:PKD repeat protein